MDTLFTFNFWFFILGFVGAIAPEIMRFYKIRMEPTAKVPWTYWLFSVLFCLLGGVLTIIIPATTLWGAFYIGLSVPVIISAATGKTPEIQPPPTKGTLSLLTYHKLSIREFMGSIWK